MGSLVVDTNLRMWLCELFQKLIQKSTQTHIKTYLTHFSDQTPILLSKIPKIMYNSSGSNFYSTSQSSQSQVFQKLKQNIQRLKAERQQLRNASMTDRNDLNNVEMAINQLNSQLQAKANIVRDKERKLMEIQRAINQTEKSYHIIVDTTTKLSNALENEANYLRNLSKK